MLVVNCDFNSVTVISVFIFFHNNFGVFLITILFTLLLA